MYSLKRFIYYPYLILKTALRSRNYYWLQFIDGKTGIERSSNLPKVVKLMNETDLTRSLLYHCHTCLAAKNFIYLFFELIFFIHSKILIEPLETQRWQVRPVPSQSLSSIFVPFLNSIVFFFSTTILFYFSITSNQDFYTNFLTVLFLSPHFQNNLPKCNLNHFTV